VKESTIVAVVNPFRLVLIIQSTHAHSALAVAVQASRDSVAITEARRSRNIAWSLLGIQR
jgi:hypothetical protein